MDKLLKYHFLRNVQVRCKYLHSKCYDDNKKSPNGQFDSKMWSQGSKRLSEAWYSNVNSILIVGRSMQTHPS